MSEKRKEVKDLTDLPGVGPKTAQKLREAGIYTLADLAMASVHELVEKVGIGEETAKLLVDTISRIYSNGYIKNEQFIEILRKLDEFARREDLDKLSNYIIELSRAIEGRLKSFEDMVKFEFSNIWQELKQLRETSATKDDIKMILGLSITIISGILMFFISKIFLP